MPQKIHGAVAGTMEQIQLFYAVFHYSFCRFRQAFPAGVKQMQTADDAVDAAIRNAGAAVIDGIDYSGVTASLQ